MPSAVPPLRPVTRDPRELPVAVFDSGVGGLTVLHECLVSLPHEDFVYLGDTARFPYGDRSPDELLDFARELAAILVERGAKLLVVACNSATAAALPALREELARPHHGDRRGHARGAAGGARHPQRPGRPARHAGHGRERRLRARARRGGPRGRAARGGVRRAGAADPGRGRGRPPGARLRRGRLRAAAGRGRRHRDPRLHPLPARPARAPARARPRGHASSAPARRSPRTCTRRSRGSGSPTPRTRRGDYRFLRSGDPEEFRRLGTRFLQLPIAAVEHVDLEAAPRARAAA